jgi:hypothetical protein
MSEKCGLNANLKGYFKTILLKIIFRLPISEQYVALFQSKFMFPVPVGVLMSKYRVSRWCAAAVLSVLLGLAGCGVPRPSDSPLILAPNDLPEPVCSAPAAGHVLTGVWYVVRKQAGVAGEVQTLLTLSADGKMRQQIRVKQGRNIRSELRETGCWEAPQGKLVLRISRSNGEMVDYRDPMYTLTYVIERVDARRVVFREDKPESRPATGQRVQDSFRLM